MSYCGEVTNLLKQELVARKTVVFVFEHWPRTQRVHVGLLCLAVINLTLHFAALLLITFIIVLGHQHGRSGQVGRN